MSTADTVFSGKGTDEVLAADVYQIKDSAPRNSIFSSMKGAAVDAAESIRNSPTNARDILRTAVDVHTGALSKADALNRLGVNTATALRLSERAIPALTKMGERMGVNPEMVGWVKVGVGSAMSYLKSEDSYAEFDAFQTTMDVLGDSEFAKVFDLEAEASMLHEVFSSAIDLGVVDIYNQLKVSNRYDRMSYESAVMSSSVNAVSSGEIDVILAVLNEITVDQFLGENPHAIQDILSNYTLRSTVTPDQYPAKLLELTTLLSRLDPNWYEVDRGGELVIDLSTMTNVSQSVKRLFELDATLRPIMLTAPFYKPTTAVTLGQALYPLSAIGVIR